METLNGRGRLPALLRWLQEHGAKIRAVEVAERNGLRGLYARHRIAPDTPVVYLPRRLLMTPQEARASAPGRLVAASEFARNDPDPDPAILAAFLAQTRRAAGFWQTYFDVLPALEDFSGMPLFFSKPDFALLEGSGVQRLVRQQWRRIKAEYKACIAVLPAAERFSLREFVWARTVVSSRSFSMTLNGVETFGVAPFADMLNHARLSSVSYHKPGSKEKMDNARGFFITTVADIQPWSEVRTNYVEQSNAQLLFRYGFCMDAGPYDTTDVIVPVQQAANPYRHQGAVAAFELCRAYKGDTRDLFSCLRLDAETAGLPDEDMLADIRKKFGSIPPLTQQNETAVLQRLAQLCNARLREFGTAIDEDERLREAPALPYHHRCIYLARRSEKQVLRHYIELAAEAIPLLRLSHFELVQALLPRIESRDRFADYYTEILAHLVLRKMREPPYLQEALAAASTSTRGYRWRYKSPR